MRPGERIDEKDKRTRHRIGTMDGSNRVQRWIGSGKDRHQGCVGISRIIQENRIKDKLEG